MSTLKSSMTHEPGSPERLQNPIPLLKSIGKVYFPMRYQVSTLGWTLVRNKFNLGDQGVRNFSEAECKAKVPADAVRALQGLYPTQKQI